jgi:hypothetical protein
MAISRQTAKTPSKTACNIAPVISGYNQLQNASSQEAAMVEPIMWNLMTLDPAA